MRIKHSTRASKASCLKQLSLWGITLIIAFTSYVSPASAQHEHHGITSPEPAGLSDSQPPSHHAMPPDHTSTAGGGWDFFTNYGMYMPRTHCLMTEAGTPDWPWIITLAVLHVGVIAAYLKIFFFWLRSYRKEEKEDRNQKMMDLALIFLWCAVCGYGMSLVIFVWPAYRLLAVFMAVLCFIAWRFVWNINDLGVSLSAKRLQRELKEAIGQNESAESRALRENAIRNARRSDLRINIRLVFAVAIAVVVVVKIAELSRWSGAELGAGTMVTTLLIAGAGVAVGFCVWCLALRPQQVLNRERIDELHVALDEIGSRNETLRRLSLVAAKTDNAVMISSPDGGIEWVNDGFTRVTGYTLDECTGKKPGSFLQGPDTDPSTVAFMRKQLAEKKGFQTEVLNYKKDGTPYWLGLDVQPVLDDAGKLTNFVAIESDITARKQSEDQLKLTTERLQLGLKASRAGDWDWNIETGEVDYSQRWLNLFGYEAEQMDTSIDFWEKRLHPDDLESVKTAIEAHFNGETDDYRCEYRLRTNDGDYLWTLACGRIVNRSVDGLPLRMQGINFDISDQKRTEADLQESESAFRGAFEQAAVGIAHVALDGTWIRVNQKLCDIVGRTDEELKNRTFKDVTHPDDIDADLEYVKRTLAGELDTYSMEKRYLHASGESVWVNLTVSLIRNHEQEPQYFVSVIEDISDRKASEAALAESEERFELAMRGANDGLWDWDIHTNKIYYSPRWKSMLGYEEHELEGILETATALIHPEDRGPLFERLDEYFASDDTTFEVECRMKYKDGPYIDILSRAIIVRDQNGNAVRAVGTHVDVTQRNRDAQEIERFKSTLDRIDDNVFMYWPDTLQFFYVNQGACESLGHTAEEMLHMTPLDLIKGMSEAEFRDLVDPLLTGEQNSLRIETRHQRKDGTDFPVEVFLQYVSPIDEPARFCAIARDITEHKRVMGDLQVAKAEAEAASQAKSEFLASMSHELRTPLNGVIGMTELLKNTDLDDRQQRFVDACHASGDSLLTLINDILDISKIEAGKLELDHHSFSIQQSVDDTVAMMAHRAHADGLELNYQIEPEVRQAVQGDSIRLRQVLVNLLSNAIKFTDQGQVLLRAALDEQDAQSTTVRFSVTDTGPGIPADKLDRLFKSFSQTDKSTTRRYGGSGLGLSICKSLAEAMNGRIGVESEEGTGSTFWFTARFDRDTETETRSTWHPEDLRGLRVLLVDDNPTSREILCKTFESWDAQVDSVASDDPFLLSQLEESVSCAFDLLVFDIPVTEGDPSILVDQFLNSDNPIAGKILFLTPVNGELAPERAKSMVSYRCLRKPPSPSELLNALTDLFCSAEDQQTVRQQTQAPSHNETASQWPRLNGRVLLAEDHPTNQMYVCELLRRAGLDVVVANNGCEAVDHLKAGGPDPNLFDVVLMDCQMPEMDGFDATRAIRVEESASDIKRHIPVIALTANAIKGDRELCLEAGMDDYLSKPVEAIALLEMIEKYLEQSDATPADPAPLGDSQDTSGAGLNVSAKDPELPLDVDAALSRCMGDADFLAATLESFATETPKYLEELIHVVMLRDSEATRRTAHSIKGAAGMITAEALRAAAADLEECGRDGREADAVEQLEHLREEADRCLQYVESVRETMRAEN